MLWTEGGGKPPHSRAAACRRRPEKKTRQLSKMQLHELVDEVAVPRHPRIR